MSLIAVYLVEHCGRRPTFLLTTLACGVCVTVAMVMGAVIMMSSAANQWASWVMAAAILVFGIAYNLGYVFSLYFLNQSISQSLYSLKSFSWHKYIHTVAS